LLLESHHRGGAAEGSHIDALQVIAPLKSPGSAALVSAFVVLEMDPHAELFRMIREWPLPSRSADAYVVERHGDEVVILSELRFRPEGQAAFRAPIQSRRLSAAAAARGETGVLEALDYRDVPVIAVALPVADSSWVLVAEMEQSEAYAEVVAEAWRTAILVALLLASIVLAGAFFWRHREAEHLRLSLEAEHQSRSLAERLALVSQNANDAILLFDEEMRIVEANDRVLPLYGRTPQAMTAGLTALDLRAPEDGEVTRALFQSVFGGEAKLFEAVHRKCDGTLFPVEVSARPVTILGRPHVLSVIRDITERKGHEREIQRLGRLYAALAHVNQSVAKATDRDALLTDACRSLVEAGGFQASWIGCPDPATAALPVVAQWGDATGYVRDLQVTITETPRGRGPSGTAFREQRTVVSNDFVNDPAGLLWREAASRAGYAAAASLPILSAGRSVAILTVYAHEAGYFGPPEVALLEETARDVGFGLERLEREAAREAAETERRVSDERLRLALTASRQGIYDVDLATGVGVVTPEYALMLGHDPATFKETSEGLTERLHPADRERALAVFREHATRGVSDYRIEFRLRTASGEYKWILSVGRIVGWRPDGSPERMLGTHTDISERKQYEAEILAVQERLEATINAIPDLLFELNREGEYLTFHSPRTELLAAPPEFFLGRNFADILPPIAVEATRQALTEADARGRSNGHQFPLDLPHGRCWFELSIAKTPGAADGESRYVALSRDITDRKLAEEELKDSLREKEALLKEVHHRVKNNLQVITSLLRLEASRSHEGATKVVLKDMQSRIRSMALLHETLYQTGNFAAVNLADYLRRLASQLFRAHGSEPDVRLVLDLEPVSLSIDNAIPCGLIVTELLTNSLKHAFAPKADGEVRLTLRVAGEPRTIEIATSDNGVGLPEDFASRRANSLGMQLVSDLTRQLRGNLEIGPAPGTTFTIRFPPDETSRRTGPTARPPAISDAGRSVAAPEPPRAPAPPPPSQD
jgi:PAS domain S-box-containing protein